MGVITLEIMEMQTPRKPKLKLLSNPHQRSLRGKNPKWKWFQWLKSKGSLIQSSEIKNITKMRMWYLQKKLMTQRMGISLFIVSD